MAHHLICKKVDSPDELEQVFRIRYHVYIEEQGKPYPEACHEKRLLFDELDRSAPIVGMFNRQECVGTVRFNQLDCPVAYKAYAEQMELSFYDNVKLNSICVTSRLAIKREWRTSMTVCKMLLQGVYRQGLLAGGTHCYLNCRPPVVPLMKRCGFREYLEPYQDRLLGPLHRFMLKLDDHISLQAARSPLFPVFCEHFGHPNFSTFTIRP